MRLTLLHTLLLCVLCTPLLAYDMGDLPKWSMGDKLIGIALPPGTEIPQTDQWPAAAWFEYNDVQFVIYAKHIAPLDLETGKARYSVWISVPPQYREEIEKERPMTGADAFAYLQRANCSSIVAELYTGPGDTWGAAEGAEPWTAQNGRCVLGVFEPVPGGIAPRAFSLYRLQFQGGASMRLGQIWCFCPNYPHGVTKAADDEWISWTASDDSASFKVDQWGLPGCSPVPEPDPPAVTTTPPATGTDTPTTQDTEAIAPFVGAWLDPTAGTVVHVLRDGIFLLTGSGDPARAIVAGTCGVSGDVLRLHTCLADPTQLWVAGAVPAAAAETLTGGDFDLTTMVQVRRAGENLVGTMRSWRASFETNGDLRTFEPWNGPAVPPTAVEWQPAPAGTTYPFATGAGTLRDLLTR